MNFLCDHMLGTLAKWLRFLGNDVAYPEALGDDELKAAAERDGSVLLTRDRELAGRVASSLYVTSDDLDEQLVQVLRQFRLEGELTMTRCSLCNTSLREATKEEVRGKVPQGVFERQSEFWRCDACGRFYWRGSHWENMNERMQRIRARASETAS